MWRSLTALWTLLVECWAFIVWVLKECLLWLDSFKELLSSLLMWGFCIRLNRFGEKLLLFFNLSYTLWLIIYIYLMILQDHFFQVACFLVKQSFTVRSWGFLVNLVHIFLMLFSGRRVSECLPWLVEGRGADLLSLLVHVVNVLQRSIQVLWRMILRALSSPAWLDPIDHFILIPWNCHNSFFLLQVRSVIAIGLSKIHEVFLHLGI